MLIETKRFLGDSVLNVDAGETGQTFGVWCLSLTGRDPGPAVAQFDPVSAEWLESLTGGEREAALQRLHVLLVRTALAARCAAVVLTSVLPAGVR